MQQIFIDFYQMLGTKLVMKKCVWIKFRLPYQEVIAWWSVGIVQLEQLWNSN